MFVLFYLNTSSCNGLHGSTGKKRRHLMSRWRWMKRRGLRRHDTKRLGRPLNSWTWSLCSQHVNTTHTSSVISSISNHLLAPVNINPHICRTAGIINYFNKLTKSSHCSLKMVLSTFMFYCNFKKNQSHHQSPYKLFYSINIAVFLFEVSVEWEGRLKAWIINH